MKQRVRTLPAWLQRGIYRAERERRTNVVVRPMRNLMDLLARGDVDEIDGRAMMRMPAVDEQFCERTAWCEIGPAIEGWIDCWKRLAPDISTYHLGVVAARLNENKLLTPRLVELARAEFENTVARIAEIPDGALMGAVQTTRIAWEFERVGKPLVA